MSNQSRQPAGVPTGGQFAASARTESGVGLDTEDRPAFGAGVGNQPLVARIGSLMAGRGTTDSVTAEDGYFPGTVRLTGPYEGELLDLAEAAAAQDLYVDLRDGQDLYDGDEGGFAFTIAENDEYGGHDTWATGDISYF